MNIRTALLGLVAGAVLVGGGFVATQTASALSGGGATATADSATDPALAGELAFARDEERMARDLYRAFAERYDGAMPFAMITTSEQRHFDAVGALLDTYGVADPAEGRKAGSYADPTVQRLYDGWLADGSASRDAAYQVGVALEKRDIADLADTLAQDPPADVQRVLTALRTASQHHLAAFEAAAAGQAFGQGYGRRMGPGAGQSYGQGYGPGTRMGMMGGWGRGAGGNRAGFDGDCPMLDAS